MSDETVQLWTTGEAAACLAVVGITRKQVARMVADKTLPSVKRGPGKWARIPEPAVLAYLEQALAQARATVPQVAGDTAAGHSDAPPLD